jgi:hypothetical protein
VFKNKISENALFTILRFGLQTKAIFYVSHKQQAPKFKCDQDRHKIIIQV